MSELNLTHNKRKKPDAHKTETIFSKKSKMSIGNKYLATFKPLSRSVPRSIALLWNRHKKSTSRYEELSTVIYELERDAAIKECDGK